jgi:cytochrome c5
MTGGEELMPPTGKLDDASLQLIRSWIESGAENTTNCDLSNSDCDTTNVTYSGTVQPIFNTHCNGCHNSGAVHNFDGYTPLSTYLATSSQILIDNINYTGAQPMPPTGELNECLRRQISIWIAAGYPNN